eukprot:TRINITY_DN4402_c0_g1_i2.p1 TRINITY_DN4402_c0_g1~~TRINITY_DN4402_c0_g1_i2.p1  ORF type:complete len:212 (-),score=22.13 TRINITY_DN4402_c0_g1_i2:56-691(-)
MKTELHQGVHLEDQKSRSCKATTKIRNRNGEEEVRTRGLKGRQNDEYWQLLTTDVHLLLTSIKNSLPDARFVVGITMLDLYPDEKWNFVFGEASPKDGTGVYSFARYGEAEDELLLRSLKTLVHEILHLCGIEHCIYFSCCINGSNSLEESDLQPMHLCPIDLLKLYLYVGGFDLLQREEQIRSFYLEHCGYGLESETEWSSRLIDLLKTL